MARRSTVESGRSAPSPAGVSILPIDHAALLQRMRPMRGFQTSSPRWRSRPSARSERASSKTVGQGMPAKPPSLKIFSPHLRDSIPRHAKSFRRSKPRNQLT